MSYTRADACEETCDLVMRLLSTVELENLTKEQAITMLDDIYGEVSEALAIENEG